MGSRALRLFPLVLATLALATGSAAAAATGPVGPVGFELQVNSYTVVREWRSAIAANEDGFVVVWDSGLHHDGDIDGVFAQRFASDGTPLGIEFQVNTYTTGYQYLPDVAMDSDGDFIVVWQSFGQDSASHGVFGQRFASDGAPTGLEFQVNATTSRDEREGSVAMDASGNFVVAWTSFLGDGSSDAVLAQRFDATGARVGTEFLVNSHTTSTQKSPRVAMTDGSFVVVWQSFGQDDGVDYGVFARRFGSNGAPLGAEFQVNLTTALTQWRPDVAMGAGGDFVVVWDSFQPGGDFREVMARRFDSSGASQGGELLVNTHTAEDQRSAAVAKDAAGAFLVTWASYIDDSSYEDVFARFFDSAGVAERPNFRVNASTPPRQDRPAVAAAGAGKFVVAWDSSLQGPGDYDIFARRVEPIPLATLDVDGDGAVAALTDGLLVLRFMFNLTGAALVNGVVDPDCTRCSASAITTYLSGLGATLDVDGDATTRALTDGLLVLRFLFNLTGATLINGVVDPDCTRCTAMDIAGYLQPLR
jgi:hypothetical protein